LAGEFDIGPLTWVKGEIDQALEKSLGCLRAYAANPAETTQLKFSRTHFHQAHGALQIVGLDGVTRVSEELEGLISETEKSGAPPKPEMLAAAERTYEAISAYLDQLLAGEPNQPLLLFAVYRDLAAARGKDSADPVDLYYPDLSRRPPRRERAPSAHTGDALIQHYRDARARYQRGLLKLLKKDPTGAEDMRAAVTAVEAAQSVPAQRTFWWVALGFFDALVARAMRDLLADCLSTLPALLQRENLPALHFHFATYDAPRRQLFPQALEAYEHFVNTGAQDRLWRAVHEGKDRWLAQARALIALEPAAREAALSALLEDDPLRADAVAAR